MHFRPPPIPSIGSALKRGKRVDCVAVGMGWIGGVAEEIGMSVWKGSGGVTVMGGCSVRVRVKFDGVGRNDELGLGHNEVLGFDSPKP